jgi:heme exporter protein A
MPFADTLATGRRPGAPCSGQVRKEHGDRAREMIRARRLGRTFGGRHVVRGLDLDVPAGGFLLVTGPNGSGKTTLLRLVAGLLVPTAGELQVDLPRDRVGYLGHEPLVYRELTALENLDLYGRLYRVPERRERIGMLLERFGLWEARNQRADSFSRGMLQRLALCRTLLHDPGLLVLDEPFNALDDEGAALLDRELADRRPLATFLVATHDPGRIAPLASGRLALA